MGNCTYILNASVIFYTGGFFKMSVFGLLFCYPLGDVVYNIHWNKNFFAPF